MRAVTDVTRQTLRLWNESKGWDATRMATHKSDEAVSLPKNEEGEASCGRAAPRR
jgi:hypothetical protein